MSADILQRARTIWAEREKGFPAFVRQTWEQGTQAARLATIIQAEAEFARDSGGRSQSQDAQRLGPEAGRTVHEVKSPTPSPFSGDPQ